MANSIESKSNSILLKEQTGDLQFPWKLHSLLDHAEEEGKQSIVSWLPHGRAFRIHDRKSFSEELMPTYFSSNKFKTFQRSLNLWGFQSVGKGPERGARFHKCFVRGQPNLCLMMTRTKVKGNGCPRKDMPNNEGGTAATFPPYTNMRANAAESVPSLITNSSLGTICGCHHPSLHATTVSDIAVALSTLGRSGGTRAGPLFSPAPSPPSSTKEDFAQALSMVVPLPAAATTSFSALLPGLTNSGNINALPTPTRESYNMDAIHQLLLGCQQPSLSASAVATASTPSIAAYLLEATMVLEANSFLPPPVPPSAGSSLFSTLATVLSSAAATSAVSPSAARYPLRL